jgi:hypothetical protein
LPTDIRIETMNTATAQPTTAPAPGTADALREFHRRIAAVIDAVQSATFSAGMHDLLGYSTDFVPGGQQTVQTLVLKSKRRSAYVRLPWDTLMSDSDADRKSVQAAISSAIRELS